MPSTPSFFDILKDPSCLVGKPAAPSGPFVPRRETPSASTGDPFMFLQSSIAPAPLTAMVGAVEPSASNTITNLLLLGAVGAATYFLGKSHARDGKGPELPKIPFLTKSEKAAEVPKREVSPYTLRSADPPRSRAVKTKRATFKKSRGLTFDELPSTKLYGRDSSFGEETLREGDYPDTVRDDFHFNDFQYDDEPSTRRPSRRR